MTTRKRLVPPEEVTALLDIACKYKIAVAGLDVGRDYVRTIPPQEGGDSLAQYLGPAHRPQEAEKR
jgi:hypothetical protein